MSITIPIIKLRDNLIVSIQTDIDDRNATELQNRLLNQIEITKSKSVLIDLSSVDMIDSFLGRLLSDIALAAATMDTKTILIGIQPAVAITLIELGLNLDGILKAISLEHALEILDDLNVNKT